MIMTFEVWPLFFLTLLRVQAFPTVKEAQSTELYPVRSEETGQDLVNYLRAIHLDNLDERQAENVSSEEELVGTSTSSRSSFDETPGDAPMIDYKTFNLQNDGFPLTLEELKRNRRLQKKAFESALGKQTVQAAIEEYADATSKPIRVARNHVIAYGTPGIIRRLVYGDDNVKMDASELLKYCVCHHLHPSCVTWWYTVLPSSEETLQQIDEEAIGASSRTE